MPSSARIILDSIGPNDARITTMELCYQRFVHSELLTHRLFSRNSASSRAIPNNKLIDRIERDPAGPVVWGTNQSGMQAAEPLEGEPLKLAKNLWLEARNDAIKRSKLLGSKDSLNVHKQIANRIIEPWMHITVLVTATEWDNYFGLRCHPAAQPEIRNVSEMAWKAYQESMPRPVHAGGWHLPLVQGYDLEQLFSEGYKTEQIVRISVGRCARVTHLTHEGVRDPKEDLELAGRLQGNGHMSPFEHPAKALTREQWRVYSEAAARGWTYNRVPVGNLWGWAQFRKELDNEHDFSKIAKM